MRKQQVFIRLMALLLLLPVLLTCLLYTSVAQICIGKRSIRIGLYALIIP